MLPWFILSGLLNLQKGASTFLGIAEVLRQRDS